jgi:ATP-dependent exoDNAse (exonuclease V) alpha subunit
MRPLWSGCAGISYALTEAMDEGHCGLPSDELMPLAAQLLEVPQDLIRTALDLELADGTVTASRVRDKPCVFLAGLYRAERNIADRLLQLRNGKLPWPCIDPDKAIPWIEQRSGLVLAESQRSAVALALTSKVLVITGGPGVDGELTVSFDGRSVSYGFGELDTLVPAYAATIHKSQGSEYPAVVIPVMTQHYAILQRNLLYTGVTRGKKLVVLVGQKKAVAIAVRNVSGRRRWAKLNEWLRAIQERPAGLA